MANENDNTPNPPDPAGIPQPLPDPRMTGEIQNRTNRTLWFKLHDNAFSLSVEDGKTLTGGSIIISGLFPGLNARVYLGKDEDQPNYYSIGHFFWNISPIGRRDRPRARAVVSTAQHQGEVVLTVKDGEELLLEKRFNEEEW